MMGKKKGDIFELYAKPLNDIPIRETSVVLKKQLIDLVNEIIALKKSNPNNDTSLLERQIDTIVYKIYGLTDAEIKIIE